MLRRFVGLALMAYGLACAQTTRIVQFRSGWTTDQTEVSQLGPGHFGGRWANHSVEFYDPGHTDEMTFVCTESGLLDSRLRRPVYGLDLHEQEHQGLPASRRDHDLGMCIDVQARA